LAERNNSSIAAQHVGRDYSALTHPSRHKVMNSNKFGVSKQSTLGVPNKDEKKDGTYR